MFSTQDKAQRKLSEINNTWFFPESTADSGGIDAGYIRNINNMPEMNYFSNKKMLKYFYEQNGLSDEFDIDNVYLENAFQDIRRFF